LVIYAGTSVIGESDLGRGRETGVSRVGR